jgi:hypothetical protein
MRTSASPTRRRFAAAVSAIALAALALVIGMGTAQAAAVHSTPTAAQAATQTQSTRIIRVTEPMHVVGIDVAVAKAHGYTVRTDAQGQEYVAKIGSAAVTPQNVEPGPCGNSWVDYSAIGERSASPRYVAVVSTGYAINPTYGLPFEGSWVVAVGDNAGTGNVNFPNPVSGSYAWSASDDTYHSVTGLSTATVLESSFVVTEEGWACYSAGPYASTTLY